LVQCKKTKSQCAVISRQMSFQMFIDSHLLQCSWQSEFSSAQMS